MGSRLRALGQKLAGWVEPLASTLKGWVRPRTWQDETPAPRLPPPPPPLALLAGPSPVAGRKPDKVAHFDPHILAVRLPPEKSPPREGAVELWHATAEFLRRPDLPAPRVVAPNGPQVELEEWPVEVFEPVDVSRERADPRSWRGGYRETDRTSEWCRQVRRQYLLRTDLPRLRYPTIPPPEELLRPIGTIDPLPRLGDAPRVEIKPHDLEHPRMGSLAAGMPRSPRPGWRSLIEQAQEPGPPEKGEGP